MPTTKPPPTTSPAPVAIEPRAAVCTLCGEVGHLESTCGEATGGSSRLVQVAIDKYAAELGEAYGVQVKLAEAIGVAKASLTRVKSGFTQFSPAKRRIVVHYLRTGKLPATPPVRRKAGRESEPVSADALDGDAKIAICTTYRDRYALLRIARLHPLGSIGVVTEALAAWAEKRPTRPSTGPTVNAEIRYAAKVGAKELAAFDAVIGGASERSAWMPLAIHEWVGREDFRRVVGPMPADIDAAIESAAAAPRAVPKARAQRAIEELPRALALSKALAHRGRKTTIDSYVEGLLVSHGSAKQFALALTATGHLTRVAHGEYEVTNPQPTTPLRYLPRKLRPQYEAEGAKEAQRLKKAEARVAKKNAAP